MVSMREIRLTKRMKLKWFCNGFEGNVSGEFRLTTSSLKTFGKLKVS